MRATIPLIAGLALSACATVPPPAPTVAVAPAPPPSPPPPLPPAPDWQDRSVAAGTWTLGQDESGSVAQFGRPGAPAEFLVRCVTATRFVYFLRAGTLPEGSTVQFNLVSTEGGRAYNAANTSSVPPYIWAETPASDPELDRLAFSRGRFLVAVAGTDDLVVPSWPEFARIVEDCRR